MVVVWSKRAESELDKIAEYISLESPQNAHIVVNSLIDATLTLPDNPLKYPPDKLKQ